MNLQTSVIYHGDVVRRLPHVDVPVAWSNCSRSVRSRVDIKIIKDRQTVTIKVAMFHFVTLVACRCLYDNPPMIEGGRKFE